MIKISLIHPSRGRAQKAFDTYVNWMNKASGQHVIEHIISIDISDPEKMKYYQLFINRSIYVVKDNTCVVEATNAAAKISSGNILVYLSDDFDCPHEWDKMLVAAFHDMEIPMLVKVDDCLQKFETKVLTIPIMNLKLYETLGYFWHPGYKSMFVDEHLYHLCSKNGWLYNAPLLKFPHLHCSIGKAERDETYIRSEANWNQGKALFAQHKEAGFPLGI
jgi:glycosyltransferase involved in cell wall biosynthesis